MYHLRRLSALVLSLAIAPLLFLPTPAAAANEDSMPLVLSSASALLMRRRRGPSSSSKTPTRSWSPPASPRS